MKIAIIGAGAMGCLYGGLLSSKEHEIWLLDIMRDHIEAIKEHGLIMQEKNQNSEFSEVVYPRVKATTDPLEIGIVDLAIVFVKSTFTKSAIEQNKKLFGPDSLVLTLQNGMGNVEAITEILGDKNIIAGTTAHGASMLGLGKMKHAGSGKTIIGELSGIKTPRLEAIAKVFNQAGLETEISENVLGLIWDKLLVNVGINALTAITGLQNGRLVEIPELQEILEMAVFEGWEVARAKNIKLNFEDPVAHTKSICIATAENRSSMLQDVLNHRKTEIQMINGAILKEGKNLGIKTPVNMVLVNLVKNIENL